MHRDYWSCVGKSGAKKERGFKKKKKKKEASSNNKKKKKKQKKTNTRSVISIVYGQVFKC